MILIRILEPYIDRKQIQFTGKRIESYGDDYATEEENTDYRFASLCERSSNLQISAIIIDSFLGETEKELGIMSLNHNDTRYSA